MGLETGRKLSTDMDGFFIPWRDEDEAFIEQRKREKLRHKSGSIV